MGQWKGTVLSVVLALVAVFAAAMPGRVIASQADDNGVARAVEALQVHAVGHRLILLGEFHGTREIPRFVQALVERYAAEGPVVLAVEIPASEQASLDAFLASRGTPADRDAVLQRPWWTRHDDQHDGRRSLDMLDLFDGLRGLRAQGRDVSVLAYDVGENEQHAGLNWRDHRMATSVRARYRASPHARVLMLMGNVHAMLARPTFMTGPVPKTAGQWLADLKPESVRIGAREGVSLGCIAVCKPYPADHSVNANGPAENPYTYGVVLDRFSVARLVGTKAY